MKAGQSSIGYITVIALLVIHLLPVWCFQYFPTQDGASHIYNAYVLKEYQNHENYRLREVYKLNTTFFPNWTSHALLVVLMYVFPPIVCEKIVLTLCIGRLPLSLFYFLNGVQKKNAVFGLVGFIYAYNYLLHMGFYNFVLIGVNLAVSNYDRCGFLTAPFCINISNNAQDENICVCSRAIHCASFL